MIFPTIEFAAFFLVVMLLSWLLMPRPALWKPFMFAVSLLFYAYADWRFVGLLLLVVVVNQAAAMLIGGSADPRRRRAVLIATVAADLALLGWFKYLDFFTSSVNDALVRLGLGVGLPLLSVALPVGISFYTFMAISYVVDVHQGVCRPAKPIDAAVYLSFFPHLVAGPIVRAREFIPQLSAPRDPRSLPAVPALFLIAGGVVKKVLVADTLAVAVVDPVFGSPDAHSAAETWLAVYGYAAQIYCDFSGYTDMAIGLAMLLGYRFPQNFDRPYTAARLQDFWRRWHMTLSRWLRDYLYIPLGGSRRGSLRTYVNLMVTMLLGGLWHGASWTFVVWGGIHGTGLCVERWWRSWRSGRAAGPEAFPDLPAGPGRQRAATEETEAVAPGAGDEAGADPVPGPRPVALRHRHARARSGRFWGWLVTFQVVCLAWVFFRSPDLPTAFQVLGQLVTGWGLPSPLVTLPVVALVVAGIGVQWLPSRVWRVVEERFSRLGILWQGILLGLLIVCVLTLVGQQGVAPFIYFRF